LKYPKLGVWLKAQKAMSGFVETASAAAVAAAAAASVATPTFKASTSESEAGTDENGMFDPSFSELTVFDSRAGDIELNDVSQVTNKTMNLPASGGLEEVTAGLSTPSADCSNHNSHHQ
jgi:hypothetical protein